MTDERTVWYRKWRPQTFAEITGQEHVTRTLRNAVVSGRLAHAYLLAGPRGTGKTTTARVLAKAVNCTNPTDGEPCDRCESCVAVREGRALDLVEMDAASNRGIDDIRDLRERVGYAASGGRYKVYLIDEVHELTQQAFDALLKTLEEPPPHVIFVLATTDAHRVPATIVSRCQRFDLTRVRLSDLTGRLRTIAAAEGIELDDDALAVIGRAATGSLRDGVNVMEQLAGSYGGRVSAAQAREGLGLTGDARALDLARFSVTGDLAAGLTLIAAVRDDGVDLRQFTREVVARLRSVLLLRAGVEEGLEDDSGAVETLRALAVGTEVRAIIRALQAFGSADFRADPQASLPLELALAEVVLAAEPAEAAALTFAEARQTRKVGEQASPEAPAAQIPAAPVTDLPPPGAVGSRSDAEPRRTATANMPADLRDRLAGVRVQPEKAAAAVPPSSDPVVGGAVPAGANDSPAAPDAAVLDDDEPPVAPAVTGEAEGPPAADAGPAPESPPGVGGREPEDVGAPLSLGSARARYRELYERTRQISALAAVHLNGGDIVALDGESITFGVPRAIFVEKLARGTKAHTVLSEATAQVFGRPFAVHCVHQPDVEDRLRAQPTRPSHLVDEAMKLGGRPLNTV